MKKIILLLLSLILPTTSFASVSFDGGGTADDVLTCGSSDDILTENGATTIAFWMSAATEGEAAGGRMIFRGTSTTGVGLYMQATMAPEFRVSGVTQLTRKANNSTIVANTPTVFILTWDGSVTAANVHMYKDGTEVGYQTTTDGVTPSDNSATSTYIGNISTGTRAFDGWIDEVAIWNTVLSSQDIENLSKSKVKRLPLQIAPSNLKRYFELNSCGDGTSCTSTFGDLSPTGGTDCTPSNNPTGTASQVLSYA